MLSTLSHIRMPKSRFSSTTALPVASAHRVATRMSAATTPRNRNATRVSGGEMPIISKPKTSMVSNEMTAR